MPVLPQTEVVCALILRDGQLLLARRSAQSDQPGLWEFPGGKVEAGESQPAALHRELYEELGIRAQPGEYIGCERRVVSGRLIALHAWQVSVFSGEPAALCHQALTWCNPLNALSYDLAPADIPLLQLWLAKAKGSLPG